MVARFTYLSFPPQAASEGSKVYSEEVAPAIRAFKGNKEAMLLTPEDGNEDFISFTLWETADDLSAFESSPEYLEVMGRIKQLAVKAVPKYYKVS